MKSVLLISDLASRTGLSIHTINYYIRLGLISPPARAERSGYRLFTEDTVELLRRVVELRRREVPLRDIIRRKQDGVL